MSHIIQPGESDGLRFINPKGLYDPAPNAYSLTTCLYSHKCLNPRDSIAHVDFGLSERLSDKNSISHSHRRSTRQPPRTN